MMNKELQEQLQQLQSQLSVTAINELVHSPLFKPTSRSLSLEEATRVSYQRAKAFTKAYGKFFLLLPLLLLLLLHIKIIDESRLDP